MKKTRARKRSGEDEARAAVPELCSLVANLIATYPPDSEPLQDTPGSLFRKGISRWALRTYISDLRRVMIPIQAEADRRCGSAIPCQRKRATCEECMK